MRLTTAALAIAAAAAGWMVAHLSSPAVRAWAAPARKPVGQGPLHLEQAGSGPTGETTVVLLHGIVGSGRSFGHVYDRIEGRVMVPDLLGFGRSMDVLASGYTAQDHVDAVVATLEGAGALADPVVVVGHSMGGVLALHLAAQLPNVSGVVAVSAPLYDSEQEGLDRISGADPLAGLVATGDLAERVCGWMCAHRELAGAVWPLFALRWPRPIAADGVLHTWPAYRQSLQSLVLDSGFRIALDTLQERDTPVVLVNGGKDGVQVEGRAEGLAATYANLRYDLVDDATHALPMSHADLVIDRVRDLLPDA